MSLRYIFAPGVVILLSASLAAAVPLFVGSCDAPVAVPKPAPCGSRLKYCQYTHVTCQGLGMAGFTDASEFDMACDVNDSGGCDRAEDCHSMSDALKKALADERNGSCAVAGVSSTGQRRTN